MRYNVYLNLDIFGMIIMELFRDVTIWDIMGCTDVMGFSFLGGNIKFR